MKNKEYQPFGPEWEKEISKHTVAEICLVFRPFKNKPGEKKSDFIKRIGKIKLEEYFAKRGFYIISLVNTLRHEEFVTLWRPNNAGNTFHKEAAGIYVDIIPGYHDNFNNMPIKISLANELFVERRIEGKLTFVIPNTKKTWEKLGVHLPTLHLEKI